VARGIDAAGSWNDLPVLADVLEEGGYADAGLLAHLRGGGPHCRGCWALDFVLGWPSFPAQGAGVA
jgi:hypothetical protein